MSAATVRVVTTGVDVTLAPTRGYVVGRDPRADVVVGGAAGVSRRHLVVEPAGGAWVVRDVSSGGIWVDGRRVQTFPLRGQVHIHLGAATGPRLTMDVLPPAAGSSGSPVHVDAASGGNAVNGGNMVTVDDATMADATDALVALLTRQSAAAAPASDGRTPDGQRPDSPKPEGRVPADKAPGEKARVEGGQDARNDQDAQDSQAGQEDGEVPSTVLLPGRLSRLRSERPGAEAGDVPRTAPPARGEQIQHPRRRLHRLPDGTTSIGRGSGSDIRLTDLLVSRRHAELRVARDQDGRVAHVDVVDVGSANGTFVNGRRVRQTRLADGDVIAIGHHLFQLAVQPHGAALAESVDSGDASFEAQGLSVWAGDKQLMHDVSFRLPPRSLLAVVGPSGAGKSTLLGALTGHRPADTGVVRYAGRDLYASFDELRRRIGYVPQDDLLHSALTVRRALEFGAELRFSADVTAAERSARIDEVLAELELTAHADTRVGDLSGGQRKRTSVAMELLTRPSLLFLDEPTSGLDAGLDKSVMRSLRSLADGGRTVVVVTHSVAHLDVCDYVLVLAPGGYVAYFGPPRGALSYFGKQDFSDVFLELGTGSGEEAGRRFRASGLYLSGALTAPSARADPEELSSLRQQSFVTQLWTLLRRTVAVLAADRSQLLLVVAFPFLLGIIPRGVPVPYGLGPAPGEPNLEAPRLLVVLILCACLMGTAGAVREIVKERAIYRRERMIGLSLGAYLAAKVVFLTVVTAAQAVVFTLVGLVGRVPPEGATGAGPLLEAAGAVVVAAVGSAMVGLVISAVVSNTDRTMPLMVLVTTSQLVLCGGLVPVTGRPGLEQLSMLSPGRWGFAGLASTADLNVIGGAAVVSDPRWNHTAGTYLWNLVFGLVVTAGAVVLCAYLLRRSDGIRPAAVRWRPGSSSPSAPLPADGMPPAAHPADG